MNSFTTKNAADTEAEKFLVQFDNMNYGGQMTADLYTEWSDVYDETLLNMTSGYKHPESIAEVATTVLTDKTCRILDVCAGTGLGGAALRSRGFDNIDALDGSSGMLEKAQSKGIYKNLFQEIISTSSLRCVEKASYDAIVTSGSFFPGHLGPCQLRVLAEVLKPGGYFLMAMRAAYLETDYLRGLEPEMKQMQADGIWRMLKTNVMPNYHNGLPGRIFVYQKC